MMPTARRKSRWPLRAVLCLLLGAPITWLVAWACAALRPTDGFPNVFGLSPLGLIKGLMPEFREPTPAGDLGVFVIGNAISTRVELTPLWTIADQERAKQILEASRYIDDVDPKVAKLYPDRRTWTIPPWATRHPIGPGEVTLVTSAWGWPARCLLGTEHNFVVRAADGTIIGPRQVLTGYWVRSGSPATTSIRRLPLRPVWSGFLLNSAFYGLLLFAILSLTPFTYCSLRARRRHRRGLCPHCASDLRATPATTPCPECGHPRR